MHEVTEFTFNDVKTRAILDEDGVVWMVAADVCRSLGLQDNKGSYSHHLRKLDKDEKAQADRGYFDGTPISNIGVLEEGFRRLGVRFVDVNRSIWIVNEFGAYRLAMRSNKENATRFQRWLAHEVIPAIRKTGGYTLHGNSVEIMESNYKFTMKRLDEVKAEKRKLVSHALSVTPFWSNIKYYKDLGLSNTEIGRIIEKSSRFVGRSLKKMKALGIEPYAVPLPTQYQIAASRLEDQTTLLAAYRTRYPDADEDMMITYALPTREVDHE